VHTHRFFEHITKYGKSSIMITYILLLQQKLLIFLKTKVLHCSTFLYSSIIFFFRFKTISKLHLFLASFESDESHLVGKERPSVKRYN